VDPGLNLALITGATSAFDLFRVRVSGRASRKRSWPCDLGASTAVPYKLPRTYPPCPGRSRATVGLALGPE
jgi:hypothetical protein